MDSAANTAKEICFTMPFYRGRVAGVRPLMCFSKSPRPRWKGFFMHLIMAGKIYRRKKSSEFVTLDTHCSRNKKIRWAPKGLHTYLFQLPEDWKINLSDLENRSEDGRDSTTSAMNALIRAGYVVRERKHDEKGRFEGYDYFVFERPEHAIEWLAENGKAVNGSPVNGKTATSKVLKPLSEVSNNEGEGERNTPAENPETVEAEIPPSKKVAPKKVSPFRECANCNGTGFDQNNSWGRCDECEGSGQANPSTQFQVTAIASPTDMPGVTLVEAVKTRAENTLEAEQMIATWITSEGEQTVKHRYNTAKQIFDPANAAAIAAHYCSVYTKNAANKGRLLADPITHFSDGLFSYLKNEESWGRNNQPGNQAQVRNGTQGQKANINNLGSNPGRYAEKPLF